MGMWKDAVSIAQSARKNKYCSKMGCEASRFEGPSASAAALVLFELEGNGGGGASGNAGDDGVAFSIRAHVR